MTKRLLWILFIIAAAVQAYWNGYRAPRKAIVRLIETGAAAVEREDLDAAMACVSERFQGESGSGEMGGSKKELRAQAKNFFNESDRLRLTIAKAKPRMNKTLFPDAGNVYLWLFIKGKLPDLGEIEGQEAFRLFVEREPDGAWRILKIKNEKTPFGR